MAANTSPIFIATANVAVLDIENADGTTLQDLITGGTDGTKVFKINVTSDDTSAVELQLHYLPSGGSASLLGTVDVAIAAGTDGAEAAVNLLASDQIVCTDADGELFIESGDKLQVAATSAVTAAKKVALVCFAGDY